MVLSVALVVPGPNLDCLFTGANHAVEFDGMETLELCIEAGSYLSEFSFAVWHIESESVVLLARLRPKSSVGCRTCRIWLHGVCIAAVAKRTDRVVSSDKVCVLCLHQVASVEVAYPVAAGGGSEANDIRMLG